MSNCRDVGKIGARLRLGVGLSALLCAGLLDAQTPGKVQDPETPAPVTSETAPDNPGALPATQGDASTNDIVVTGTLIRGIAPAGSQVIGLSDAQVAATGATTTTQLLANIPQVSNFFNTLVAPGSGVATANAVVPISRPNLRNLPGANQSGGAVTLILIDGHRVVGAGIGQIAVDPDIIPPGALERVEAITDGGSAVYGSDAIGGVINFITRRRFDGVLASGRYGFADDYKTYDGNLTVGKDWGDGSLYVSYGYSRHSALFGIDRNYVRQIDYVTGLPTSRQCDVANITTASGTRSFALPGLQLGTFNSCDATDYQTIYPRDEQHHVLAGFEEDLNDAITVNIRGFYTERHDLANGGPYRSTVNLTPANPNYRNLPAPDANLTQAVQFDFAPVYGNYASRARTTLRTWNITPSVSVDLPHDFQLRGLFNYGESFTEFDNNQLFTSRVTAAAAGTTAATALNPYNIAATPRALLDSLLTRNIGRSHDEFTNARVILDGALVRLPGGEVRIAAGGEYFRTYYRQRLTNTTTFVFNPPTSYTQSVKSVFGEVQIPIFGADNGFDGIRALNLSASGRYDKYNDFGDTFNPKFGITYKPLDWIEFNGNYGESFTAPSATDQLGVQVAQSLVISPGAFPNGAVLNPAVPNGQTTYAFVLLRGAIAGLVPQTSKNFSVGGKIQPPFIPGLTVSGSFYHIKLKNQISSPNSSTDIQVFFRQFPELVIVDPTPAQLQGLASQVNGGLTNLATIPIGGRVVSAYDIRARNLGVTRLSGIDFAASYTHKTGFGSFDLGVSGNYQTLQKSQNSPTAPIIDRLATATPKLRLVGTAGVTVGSFRAQATVNHSAGFDIIPLVGSNGVLLQDRVKAYDPVNLYFRYDLRGDGLTKDLTLTLNIDNVLDDDPPILRNLTQTGFSNGTTIGRVVQFGIAKKF